MYSQQFGKMAQGVWTEYVLPSHAINKLCRVNHRHFGFRITGHCMRAWFPGSYRESLVYTQVQWTSLDT